LNGLHSNGAWRYMPVLGEYWLLNIQAQYSYQIYLWSLFVCLFLFCFVCHFEISQTTAPLAMLLVSLESSQWVGVHWFGFTMFQPTTMEIQLLNIERFFTESSFKWKTKNYREVGACSSYCWKALDERDIIKAIWKFLDLKVGARDIEFWVVFIIESQEGFIRCFSFPQYFGKMTQFFFLGVQLNGLAPMLCGSLGFY
jgi:hypothetical protein